jgi:hypothetical protein
VETTTADRPDFTLSVPSRWEAVDCESGYEFRNRTLPEQIIVTVLRHKREMGAAELDCVLERLVTARRNGIAKLSSGKARLGETSLRRGNGQVEARVLGEDPANSVRLAFVIRVTPRKSVTAALNRYSPAETGVPFDDYANTIFDLFQVKDV